MYPKSTVKYYKIIQLSIRVFNILLNLLRTEYGTLTQIDLVELRKFFMSEGPTRHLKITIRVS